MTADLFHVLHDMLSDRNPALGTGWTELAARMPKRSIPQQPQQLTNSALPAGPPPPQVAAAAPPAAAPAGLPRSRSFSAGQTTAKAALVSGGGGGGGTAP